MAISVWGLMLLPGCDIGRSDAANGGNGPLSLSASQDEALKWAVDTLIPTTDTPGAVDLDVHHFVQNILKHCYEEEARKDFVKGLDLLQRHAKDDCKSEFGTCSKEQRIQLLHDFEQSEEERKESFYALLKELTILGYTTSEYVMTNLTNYTMVPGHFNGCVSLK